MSNKRLRHTRAGKGALCAAGRSPDMITLRAAPLHTSDGWEAAGRPFWLVRWLMAAGSNHPRAGMHVYGRTLTPTFCPLAVCGIPPIAAIHVEAGAVGWWKDVEWVECRDMRGHRKTIGKDIRLNPVQLVTWSSNLLACTAQQFAVPGDIGVATAAPVARSESQYVPPAGVEDHRPEVSQLITDGCPNTTEGE